MKKCAIILTILSVFLASGVQSQSVEDDGTLTFQDQQVRTAVKVELYPNPASEVLNINILDKELESTEFTLHNIIGNTIRVDVEQVGEFKYRMKVEELAPGYYLLAVKDADKKFNQIYKFLKR